MLLLMGFAAYLLVISLKQRALAITASDAEFQSVKTFYQRKPFSSQANINIEKNNAKSLHDWSEQLLENMKVRQIEFDSDITSPSTFKNLYTKKRNGLIKEAKRIGVICAKDSFGFEKYSEGGGLPAASYVPRLTQQLTIIEKICSILFKERIKELIEVRREEFEDVAERSGGGFAQPPTPRVGNSSDKLSVFSSASPRWASKDSGEFIGNSFYSRMKFRFVFTAKESAILSVLNELASSSDIFIVVTSVEIENEGALAAAEKETDKEADVKGILFENKLKSNDAADSKPETKAMPTKRERMVYGPELEKPSKMTLDIDVYKFKTEKQDVKPEKAEVPQKVE